MPLNFSNFRFDVANGRVHFICCLFIFPGDCYILKISNIYIMQAGANGPLRRGF